MALDHSRGLPSPGEFKAEAARWLSEHADLRRGGGSWTPRDDGWGVGSDRVGTYDAHDDLEIRARLDAEREWQRVKFEHGFGALTWPTEYGGRDLPAAYQRIFDGEEARYDVAAPEETMRISLYFVTPTVRLFGTPEQRAQFIDPLLRGDDLACLLLSEPDAGSDLASLRTQAVPKEGGWTIDGQKVWSSGTRFCDYGLTLARTGAASETAHGKLTAFLLPVDLPGVEVRPIRQMTGQAYFHEVHLAGVEVADEFRLGAVDQGWRVVMTAMAIDRVDAGGGGRELRRMHSLLGSFARRNGLSGDPLIRQELARAYPSIHQLGLLYDQVNQSVGSSSVGPSGSLLKLAWAQASTEVGELAGRLLGPRLLADTDEWGTYAWASHILGAPAIHLGGGTDEIQRNVLAHEILRLPKR